LARWSSCQVDRSSYLIHVWCRFDARMLLSLWLHNQNLAYLLTTSVKRKSHSWKSARVHCVIGANISHWLFLIHLGVLFPCFVKIPDIQCRQNAFTFYLSSLLQRKIIRIAFKEQGGSCTSYPSLTAWWCARPPQVCFIICSCSSYLIFPPVASQYLVDMASYITMVYTSPLSRQYIAGNHLLTHHLGNF
jgi:hypothetical protein